MRLEIERRNGGEWQMAFLLVQSAALNALTISSFPQIAPSAVEL
jgi:hypothetical protein